MRWNRCVGVGVQCVVWCFCYSYMVLPHFALSWVSEASEFSDGLAKQQTSSKCLQTATREQHILNRHQKHFNLTQWTRGFTANQIKVGTFEKHNGLVFFTCIAPKPTSLAHCWWGTAVFTLPKYNRLWIVLSMLISQLWVAPLPRHDHMCNILSHQHVQHCTVCPSVNCKACRIKRALLAKFDCAEAKYV